MDITRTIRLEPGHYVVAVSGGVDSIALLHMLMQQPGLRLTVAHYDHGIRSDSAEDRLFVESLARSYNLPFVYDEGKLGDLASEDQARIARYKFLRQVRRATKSSGIVTAHHLDDVMETGVHNMLRGTGRKGLSGPKSIDGIIRPLTHLPKSHLVSYARKNELSWREDSTNSDTKYRRNYIRHVILPRLREASPEAYEQLKHRIRRQQQLNEAIDQELGTILHVQPATNTLRRHDVIMLPHKVAIELLAEWLRRNNVRQFNKPLLERLLITIKTARPNTSFSVDRTAFIQLSLSEATVIRRVDDI